MFLIGQLNLLKWFQLVSTNIRHYRIMIEDLCWQSQKPYIYTATKSIDTVDIFMWMKSCKLFTFNLRSLDLSLPSSGYWSDLLWFQLAGCYRLQQVGSQGWACIDAFLHREFQIHIKTFFSFCYKLMPFLAGGRRCRAAANQLHPPECWTHQHPHPLHAPCVCRLAC